MRDVDAARITLFWCVSFVTPPFPCGLAFLPVHAFQVTIEDDGDGTMSHFVQPAVRLARRSCPGARVRIAGFGACWLSIAVQVKIASIRSYEELPEFLKGIGCRCRRPLKEVCAGALGRVGPLGETKPSVQGFACKSCTPTDSEDVTDAEFEETWTKLFDDVCGGDIFYSAQKVDSVGLLVVRLCGLSWRR